MFKLYKKLTWKDWIGVVFILGFTVLQVYLTMTIVDYMKGIIEAITYVNYQNNPAELGEEFAHLVATAGGWEAFKDINILTNPPYSLPLEVATLLSNIANASVGDIWYYGGMMVAFAACIMAVQIVIAVIASRVAANLSSRIREDVYRKVEGFSLAEMNHFSTPSLITRTTNDIQQVQMANLMMMRMIFAAPVTAIWAIVKVNASSTELTLATAIAIIILVIVIMLLMMFAIPKFKIVQKLTDQLNGATRENVKGIRIVRAYNAEQYQEEKFQNVNQKFTKTQIFTGRLMSVFSPVMMIVMNGISLAMYWIGASLINRGKIDYATITSFSMLSSQIIMAFLMLMMMFVLWPRASVAASRIHEVLNTKNSIVDPSTPIPFSEKGTIEFKDVSFHYPESEGNVLRHISFQAKQGETIALIGATGSGKTTLVNLLPRLYEASEGEVLVDGVNVKEVKQKDLRDRIGYVPQKGFLFKGTIKSNIAFGSPQIGEEEVVTAAKVAEADSFIQGMENGYDSYISQGGKNVSGGQRQRLCIARAVAMKPEIYIFDDSFSALDYKTDKQVRSNLKQLDRTATKFIVAQRVGTIMDADQILVLDQGEIVGKGKHEELLRNCPIYREIALSQLSKEELGL